MMSRHHLVLFWLCSVWAAGCYCKALSNAINSTEDGNIIVTDETTSQPMVTEILQGNTLAIRSSSSSSPSSTSLVVNDNVDIQGESPGESWMGRNSSIPVIALSSIVLVLVFVVTVLSVIIVVYRKRMHRMKTLITKLPSPSGSPTHAQILFDQENEDINHNPPAPRLTVTSLTSSEIDALRIPSLKYDQPYAHQKSITDRVRQMVITPPVSPQRTSISPVKIDDEPYLTPKEITPTSQSEIPPISSSSLNEFLASGDSGEYQVPRNAKKRAGLLTRDPSTKEPGTDDEYVVMMGDQPITDDEKTERSRKCSTAKESLKKGANSLKKIPGNLTSRIKFFQERMKTDQKHVTPAIEEKPQYDVPRGILK